jgi:hypothetical protein
MSGPIVRTGTTPKFWENWDKVFGQGKGAAKKKAARPAAAKSTPKRKSVAKKKSAAKGKKS